MAPGTTIALPRGRLVRGVSAPPAARGRTGIVPCIHVTSIYDLDPAEHADLWRLTAQARTRLAAEVPHIHPLRKFSIVRTAHRPSFASRLGPGASYAVRATRRDA